MKYYLAGPMTGLPQFNFPTFHAVAASLRQDGHDVVNPAEVNPDVTMPWEECMKRDLPEMLTCEAVMCLPEWHRSRGARLEVFVAGTLGMPVHQFQGLVMCDACNLWSLNTVSGVDCDLCPSCYEAATPKPT